MLWPLGGLYTAVVHLNIHSHIHTLMMGEGGNLAQYLAQRHWYLFWLFNSWFVQSKHNFLLEGLRIRFSQVL